LTTDVLTNFRYTGRDISESSKVITAQVPIFMKGAQANVDNFAVISANIKRLTSQHWYDKTLGYILNFAILYRSLNPVTNFTLSGAQFISSQK
jgi:hypothetical protein